eukprot:1340900-Amorphochlora_amoeboformis.AAC.1
MFRSYCKPSRLTEDVLQTYKNLLKLKNWDDALLEMTKITPTAKAENKISLVECPIVIVHGTKDKLIPLTDSKSLRDHLERHGQQGDLICVEDCGHVPHEELPDEFSDILLESTKEGRYSLFNANSRRTEESI